MGNIRWLKALGRPLTPTLAEAFVIDHQYHLLTFVVVPGGGIEETESWVKLPTPSAWDGPEDDQYYLVSFQTSFATSFWTNRIRVSFADQIKWTHPSNPRLDPGYRRIEPPAVYFTEWHQLTVLEDFQVVHVPFPAHL